jgi:hypothetical protein
MEESISCETELWNSRSESESDSVGVTEEEDEAVLRGVRLMSSGPGWYSSGSMELSGGILKSIAVDRSG